MSVSIEGINLSGVALIILFLIPGFITDKIIRYRFPKEKESPTELLLDSLFYSCINYALFSWLVLISLNHLQSTPPLLLLFIVEWIVTVLIGPVLLGIIMIWMMENFPNLGLVHPIKTAWDHHFSKEVPYWILVTFEDGKRLGGYYSGNSFASSFQDEKDLYIQELWKLDKDGTLDRKIENSAGVWVKMDNVKCIEFWEVKKSGGR